MISICFGGRIISLHCCYQLAVFTPLFTVRFERLQLPAELNLFYLVFRYLLPPPPTHSINTTKPDAHTRKQTFAYKYLVHVSWQIGHQNCELPSRLSIFNAQCSWPTEIQISIRPSLSIHPNTNPCGTHTTTPFAHLLARTFFMFHLWLRVLIYKQIRCMCVCTSIQTYTPPRVLSAALFVFGEWGSRSFVDSTSTAAFSGLSHCCTEKNYAVNVANY